MNDDRLNNPEELDRRLRETLEAGAPAPNERMRTALRDFQARLADHPAVLKAEAARRPRRAFPLWRWGVGLGLATTLAVAVTGGWILFNPHQPAVSSFSSRPMERQIASAPAKGAVEQLQDKAEPLRRVTELYYYDPSNGTMSSGDVLASPEPHNMPAPAAAPAPGGGARPPIEEEKTARTETRERKIAEAPKQEKAKAATLTPDAAAIQRFLGTDENARRILVAVERVDLTTRMDRTDQPPMANRSAAKAKEEPRALKDDAAQVVWAIDIATGHYEVLGRDAVLARASTSTVPPASAAPGGRVEALALDRLASGSSAAATAAPQADSRTRSSLEGGLPAPARAPAQRFKMQPDARIRDFAVGTDGDRDAYVIGASGALAPSTATDELLPKKVTSSPLTATAGGLAEGDNEIRMGGSLPNPQGMADKKIMVFGGGGGSSGAQRTLAPPLPGASPTRQLEKSQLKKPQSAPPPAASAAERRASAPLDSYSRARSDGPASRKEPDSFELGLEPGSIILSSIASPDRQWAAVIFRGGGGGLKSMLLNNRTHQTITLDKLPLTPLAWLDDHRVAWTNRAGHARTDAPLAVYITDTRTGQTRELKLKQERP